MGRRAGGAPRGKECRRRSGRAGRGGVPLRDQGAQPGGGSHRGVGDVDAHLLAQVAAGLLTAGAQLLLGEGLRGELGDGGLRGELLDQVAHRGAAPAGQELQPLPGLKPHDLAT